MWRFLYRQRLAFVWRRSGASLFAVLAVALASVLDLRSEERPQEEQLTIAGRAANVIIIREHAGWNKLCEAIVPPALYLSEPPRHGRVCARIENIKISSMYAGSESQCVGHRIDGVQLIYRSDAAYVGGDGLRYAVQYPSVLRTIAVKVTVAAHTQGAAPSNVVAPMPQSRQPAGPVPVCADPAF